MIRICDLFFAENEILTKEMLTQMNQEPKWLFLTDNFKDINNGTGIISGFQFINSMIDDFSILTKGNLLIDGKWYRMDDDFIFSSEGLISGKFYNIVLKKTGAGVYDIGVLDVNAICGKDICIAKFKYDYDNHKRVFRVPDRLEKLEMKNALLHDIAIPYYNNYGVAICPPHIACCIKNSLAGKKNRSIKEEIIFQTLLNEKNISIASILDLIGITENIENTVLISDDIIRRLRKQIELGHEKSEMSDNVLINTDVSKANQGSKINNVRKPKKGAF